MIDFPMPGDVLGDQVVIASAWYTDQIAVLLLLNKGVPYFTVSHYYLDNVDAEYGLPARNRGDWLTLGTFENIIPAAREYEQSGGDY